MAKRFNYRETVYIISHRYPHSAWRSVNINGRSQCLLTAHIVLNLYVIIITIENIVFIFECHIGYFVGVIIKHHTRDRDYRYR